MRILDRLILSLATGIAAFGVGALIIEELRGRSRGVRLEGSLGWTLLWAAGLAVLFAAAWSSRSR